MKKGTPFLYNLATDIHEDHDIAAGHPDIVKQMKEIIRTQHTPGSIFAVPEVKEKMFGAAVDKVTLSNAGSAKITMNGRDTAWKLTMEHFYKGSRDQTSLD